MDEDNIRRMLEEVADGELAVADALSRLRGLPFEDLGFAKVDLHRSLRRGFPEVIYCRGKTPEQIAAIIERLRGAESIALASCADGQLAAFISERFDDVSYDEAAQIVCVGPIPGPTDTYPPLVVLSAGTSDIPIARQATLTARAGGCPVEEVFDVGVAGLHRLLHYRALLDQAGAIVVVAGMEGALPSVVGGLVSAPVIAVPTSVGYGASFGGVAALLAMLNSCAGGVAVVNIDNGFGAGLIGAMICKQSRKPDG